MVRFVLTPAIVENLTNHFGKIFKMKIENHFGKIVVNNVYDVPFKDVKCLKSPENYENVRDYSNLKTSVMRRLNGQKIESNTFTYYLEREIINDIYAVDKISEIRDATSLKRVFNVFANDDLKKGKFVSELTIEQKRLLVGHGILYDEISVQDHYDMLMNFHSDASNTFIIKNAALLSDDQLMNIFLRYGKSTHTNIINEIEKRNIKVIKLIHNVLKHSNKFSDAYLSSSCL